EICFGSTSTATALCPEPYSTAGILPATRTRRAAFLLNLPSRGLATTTSGILSLVSLNRARAAWSPLPLLVKLVISFQLSVISIQLPAHVPTDNRLLTTDNSVS